MELKPLLWYRTDIEWLCRCPCRITSLPGLGVLGFLGFLGRIESFQRACNGSLFLFIFLWELDRLFGLFLLYSPRFFAVPSTSFLNFSLGPLPYFLGWIFSLQYILNSSFQSVVPIFPAVESVSALFAFSSTPQPFLHLNFGFASKWGAGLNWVYSWISLSAANSWGRMLSPNGVRNASEKGPQQVSGKTL